MLDNKSNQDVLSIEMEDQGAMELSDQEEEQPMDSMELLVCREPLFSDSQLVEMVNNPNPNPMSPVMNIEMEKALQPGDIS